jgi:hypothetical protein
MRRVVGAAMMGGARIHDGIFRKMKHISVISWGFAAEESLTPYVIQSQDSASIRDQLKKHGLRFGTDMIIVLNAKPHISAGIFLDYIQVVFLSHLAELIPLDIFTDSSHVTSDMVSFVAEAQVRVITFAPHTT